MNNDDYSFGSWIWNLIGTWWRWVCLLHVASAAWMDCMGQLKIHFQDGALAWLGSWCWLPGRAQLVLLVRGLGSPPLGHLHVATWAFSQGDAWIQETWVEVTSVIFYWSSQLLSPAQIQREVGGVRLHLSMGRVSESLPWVKTGWGGTNNGLSSSFILTDKSNPTVV